MKYIKAIGVAVLAALAFILAAQATQKRLKTGIKRGDELAKAKLVADIRVATGAAKVRMESHLVHIERAEEKESQVMAILDKGGNQDETINDAFDRYSAAVNKSKRLHNSDTT